MESTSTQQFDRLQLHVQNPNVCSFSNLDDVQSSDKERESHGNAACPACADGNMPSGAHKCHSCKKNVHVLVQCSVSIGAEEGYGELRKCIPCYRSVKGRSEQSEPTQEINEQEKLTQNKRSTNGKYVRPQPNFGPVNKKVIPLLLNASKSKTDYSVKNNRIKLSNTCAIDSVIQLIAAAYAYHPKFRSEMVIKEVGVFNIAKVMADR